MPTFKYNNWTTDAQADLETIARFSPHWDDRITAIKHMDDPRALRKLEGELRGSEAEAVRERLNEVSPDYDYDD